MKSTIMFDGLKFTKTGTKKYYYNSSIRRHLHQYVWEKQNGKIPKGYEIHHMDLNTENNDLKNLQLLTVKEHRKLHALLPLSKERKEFLIKNLNEKARPKAKEWHKTEKGKEWHKLNYEKNKHLLHKEQVFKCECCEKEFFSIQSNSRFCSNSCKSKYRRKSGIDNIVKKCLNCGKEFTSNKYSKTENCSRSCANKTKR